MKNYFINRYGAIENIDFTDVIDEIVNGGIAFKISDDDYSREYIIEVNESAGKKRKLELKVSF